jgi:hypothetical protein
MNSEPIINLLVQIPLVGAFMWLMLKIMDRQDQREAKKDELDRAERKEREEAWQLFLKEQREQNNTAIGRIAEEVKSLSSAMAQMNAVLTAHDASSREARIKMSNT